MWRVAIMVLALLDTGCMAVAAEPLEDPTNILAAQLRDQGYECNRPKSAERDVQASKPDEEVWIGNVRTLNTACASTRTWPPRWSASISPKVGASPRSLLRCAVNSPGGLKDYELLLLFLGARRSHGRQHADV